MVLDGGGPIIWNFEGEYSSLLVHKQSVALIKHREHCGVRRSQRRFAVAQLTQDLRREGWRQYRRHDYEGS